MTKLIYTAITSLDGYVADEDGKFDWSAPDEDVHAFINDLERPVGTYLLGRRMYLVGMWVTAVVGLVCLVRVESRPIGKELLAAASGTLSLFPVILFGAVFSSLG